MGKIKITASQKVDMIRRYTAGETLVQIAERMGVTKATIRFHLSAQGVNMRPSGRRPALSEEQRARMLKLRDSTCLSVREVAHRFGVSVAAFYRAVDDEYIKREQPTANEKVKV